MKRHNRAVRYRRGWQGLALVAVVGASGLVVGSARAGEVLDDLPVYPVVDTACTKSSPVRHKCEGLVLVSQGTATLVPVTKDEPVGQTFRVGDKARVLWRVSLGICYWPNDWTEGEAITLTLYDSPARDQKLYTRTVTFERKWTKWDTGFDVHLPTQPDKEYYFELTYDGPADGEIRVVAFEEDHCPDTTAYVAGKPEPGMDLYYVTLVKNASDPRADLERFLKRFNYEDPRLAEAGKAYRAGDWDKACAGVLDAFGKQLADADYVWRPDAGYDVSEIASVVEDGLYCKEVDAEDVPANVGVVVESDKEGPGTESPAGAEAKVMPRKRICVLMTDQTTWRETWPGRSDHVRQNDLFRKLGWAYAVTKDERYARKLNDLMADYIQDNASPFDGGMRGGRWVAMFIAWRLGDAWSGLANAWDSQGLTDDVKLAWIDYWDRMATFAMNEPSGGNHANAVGEALMQFALKFPLYADSKKYFAYGFQKLINNSRQLFYADGACREPAMNYHGYSLLNLLEGVKTAKRYGVEIPQDVLDIVEKALAYTAYVLRPNGTIPAYGDTNCEDFRPGATQWTGWRENEAMLGYTMFGRDDMLYIATAGEKGKRPESTSQAWPDMGHYVMRSDWGGPGGEDFEDARYLFFRGGQRGSHGHEDLNMVTLSAYGRPLLIDPGRTTYGTPLMAELSRPWSHNVLIVDDIRMQRATPHLHTWAAMPAMDIVDNEYEELYPGIDHRRAVVFVRPDYFLMFDSVYAKKPTRVGLNFWLTPPEVTVNSEEATVHTNEPDGANLWLKCLRPSGVQITQRQGTVDLEQLRSDIPVVTFWQSNVRKSTFVTAMYPYPKGAVIKDFPGAAAVSGDTTFCTLGPPAQRDYVFYCTGIGHIQTSSEIAFDGRAGLIRTADDTVRSFALVDGVRVLFHGKVLAEARQPLNRLSVRYLDDRVKVVCRPEQNSLRIATYGRSNAIVNGRQRSVAGDYFKPFD